MRLTSECHGTARQLVSQWVKFTLGFQFLALVQITQCDRLKFNLGISHWTSHLISHWITGCDSQPNRSCSKTFHRWELWSRLLHSTRVFWFLQRVWSSELLLFRALSVDAFYRHRTKVPPFDAPFIFSWVPLRKTFLWSDLFTDCVVCVIQQYWSYSNLPFALQRHLFSYACKALSDHFHNFFQLFLTFSNLS